ncbi:MAG: peptidogalycan biosysnthesis protein, partial [Gallionellaceae bacterium]
MTAPPLRITPSLRIISDITDIPEADWDAVTGGDPFVSHAYLYALQVSGCATAEFGWQAQFITLWQDKKLVGAMPLYLKMNSYGEHVFDFAWAEAYQRHGLQYYHKLACLVPFAPVTGPRLLAANVGIKEMLLDAALEMAKDTGMSSLHCLFLNEADVGVAQSRGMM